MYLKYIFNLLRGEDYAYNKANEEICKLNKLYIEQEIKLVNLRGTARKASKIIQSDTSIIAKQNKAIDECTTNLKELYVLTILLCTDIDTLLANTHIVPAGSLLTTLSNVKKKLAYMHNDMITNDRAMNGRAMNGRAMNGRAMNGREINVMTTNNLTVDALTREYMELNDQTMNTQTMNDTTMNAQTMNGRAMNGRAMNGRAMNGMTRNDMIRATDPIVATPISILDTTITTEQLIASVDNRLGEIDNRLGEVDNEVDTVNKRIDRLEKIIKIWIGAHKK